MLQLSRVYGPTPTQALYTVRVQEIYQIPEFIFRFGKQVLQQGDVTFSEA